MNRLNKWMLMLTTLLLINLPAYAYASCDMGGSRGSGKIGMLLLALAAGYGVLVLSQSQSRPLNVIGRIIGGLVLVVSFVGLICYAACGLRCKMSSSCGNKSACDWGAKKGCPMSVSKMDEMAGPPAIPSADGSK